MINLKKRFIVALLLILLIFIAGCKTKKGIEKALEEIRSGTEGIVVSFLPNAPPEKIFVAEKDEEFEIILEVKNKGAYPQPNEGNNGQAPRIGKVYISGFDKNIITIKPKEGGIDDLSTRALEGKSSINPNGGLDIIGFTATVSAEKLNVEKYDPTLLATACYNYQTVAGPSVCIDPLPYSTNDKKVCQVQDVTLTSQGAPIAVTRIDEEAFASKIQFKITIKNVGKGDVIKEDALDRCNPFGEQKISRDDVDKVMLEYVKISNTPLLCGPFSDGPVKGYDRGLIRLINNEGFIICELSAEKYSNTLSAYTTPLVIELSYGYRNTAEKKIQIKKENIQLDVVQIPSRKA